MMIQVVSFDAFKTVCDVDAAVNPYDGLCQRLGVADRHAFLAQVMCGDRSQLQQDEVFRKELAVSLQSIFMYEDSLPALADLREQGFKLAITSNVSQEYADVVRSLFSLHVDYLCLSCEIGAKKPHPAIFQALCRYSQCEPGQILHVGDKALADVKGAQQAGLQAIKIDRSGKDRSAIVDLYALKQLGVLTTGS